MDEYVSLNNSWFGRLTNPNHDGITQQVDDSVMAFVTDNALFIERRWRYAERWWRQAIGWW